MTTGIRRSARPSGRTLPGLRTKNFTAMKILKKLLWFVAAACVLSGCADDRMIYKPGSGSGNGGNGGGGEQPSGPGDYSKLTAANHPRIIMSEDDVTAIKAKLAAGSDANLKKLHECIMAYADKALTAKDLVYEVTGKRLLSVSTEAANRIISCSYAYRLTGEDKYLEKAEKDMQTVCAFKDWNSVLASIGHGGLKEGQVINKMMEEREKKLKREITDADVLSGIADTAGRAGEASVRKSKSGIMVKGIHDLAVRFSKCCNPVPGDEIVGFVTRGRGVSIHRTDCVNIINLPEDERSRMIDAEWQMAEGASNNEQYSTEIKIFANNRIGMFADISKVFTEKQIDITSMNVRTSKQGKATIIMTFDIHGTDELNRLTDKIRQIEGVLDIERTTG